MHLPTRNNEISGLMIMGLSGGAIFPLLMGILSDAMQSQTGAILVLSLCIIYLILLTSIITERNNK